MIAKLAVALVHGALVAMAIAMIIVVAASWSADVVHVDLDWYDHTRTSICGPDLDDDEDDVYTSVVPPRVCDDYRPAPPSDGSWCGVPLDEPLGVGSPLVEKRTASFR